MFACFGCFAPKSTNNVQHNKQMQHQDQQISVTIVTPKSRIQTSIPFHNSRTINDLKDYIENNYRFEAAEQRVCLSSRTIEYEEEPKDTTKLSDLDLKEKVLIVRTNSNVEVVGN